MTATIPVPVSVPVPVPVSVPEIVLQFFGMTNPHR